MPGSTIGGDQLFSFTRIVGDHHYQIAVGVQEIPPLLFAVVTMLDARPEAESGHFPDGGVRGQLDQLLPSGLCGFIWISLGQETTGELLQHMLGNGDLAYAA